MSTDPVIGIVVAVQEEWKAVSGRLTAFSYERTGGLLTGRGIVRGKSVALIKSGMGAARAASATETLISRAGPAAILVCGFCAGLDTSIRPGDLVLADRVYEAATDRCQAADPELLSAAMRVAEIGARIGGIVTCPEVATRAVDKRRLQREGAAALDMESYGAAGAAVKAGVPWLAVRAVTDALEDDLPFDFSSFAGPEGEVARSRIAFAALLHPWKVPALIRLGARSAVAARNLAAFVEDWVEAFPTCIPGLSAP